MSYQKIFINLQYEDPPVSYLTGKIQKSKIFNSFIKAGMFNVSYLGTELVSHKWAVQERTRDHFHTLYLLCP